MGRAYGIIRDSALEAKGRDWRNIIIAIEAIRYSGPWLIGAAVLGGLGYGAYWLWTAMLVPAFTPDPDTTSPTVTAAGVGAMPGWVWLATLVLAGAAFWLFRPGRIVVRPGLRVVQAMGLLIVAAGFVGAGLSGLFQ